MVGERAPEKKQYACFCQIGADPTRKNFQCTFIFSCHLCVFLLPKHTFLTRGSWTPQEVQGPVDFLFQEVRGLHLFNKLFLNCLLYAGTWGERHSLLPPKIWRCFCKETANVNLPIHGILRTYSVQGTGMSTGIEPCRMNRVNEPCRMSVGCQQTGNQGRTGKVAAGGKTRRQKGKRSIRKPLRSKPEEVG